MSVPVQKPGESFQNYQTPDAFRWAALKLLGQKTWSWDLAASKENSQSPYGYYNEELDAFTKPWNVWDGWIWLNPPYKDIRPWAEKCYQSSQIGAKIAFLVPASVGANWYRDFIHNKAYVLFLNGRLAFIPDKPNWLYPKDLILVLYNKWAIGSNVWDWKG
jgi:phage N-6-adenine-methyltransferase